MAKRDQQEQQAAEPGARPEQTAIPGTNDPAPEPRRKLRSTVTYEADSLADVAEHLGEEAATYEARSSASKYARDREREKYIAEGIRHAQKIVKATTLTS